MAHLEHKKQAGANKGQNNGLSGMSWAVSALNWGADGAIIGTDETSAEPDNGSYNASVPAAGAWPVASVAYSYRAVRVGGVDNYQYKEASWFLCLWKQ